MSRTQLNLSLDGLDTKMTLHTTPPPPPPTTQTQCLQYKPSGEGPPAHPLQRRNTAMPATP